MEQYRKKRMLFNFLLVLNLPLALFAALIVYFQYHDIGTIPGFDALIGLEDFFGKGFTSGLSLPLPILSVLAYLVAFVFSFSRLSPHRPRKRILLLHAEFGILLGVFVGCSLAMDPGVLLAVIIGIIAVLWVVLGWLIEALTGKTLNKFMQFSYDRGNFGAVNTVLPAVVMLNPSNQENKRMMGISQYEAANTKRAIDILEPLHQSSNDYDPEIMRVLDECYRTEKEWLKALEINREILSQEPDNRDVRMRLAHLLKDQGQTAEAAELIQERLDEKSREELEFLLELDIQLGKNDEALETIRKLAALKGSSLKKALDACRGLIEKQPKNTRALQCLGDLLVQNGQKEEACEVFEQIVEAEGQRYDLRNRLVHLYQELDALDKAEPHLATLMDAGKDSRDIALLYGNILVKREDYDQALMHFQYAVENYPHDYRFAYFLAQISFQTEALDDALRWCDEAIERTERPEEKKRVRALRTKIHRSMSDRDLQVLEERSRREPENADLQMQYLAAMVKHGLVDRAVGEYDVFLSNHPKKRSMVIEQIEHFTQQEDANFRLLDYLTDLKIQDGAWDDAYELTEKMARHSLSPSNVIKERCERILRGKPDHVPSLRRLGGIKRQKQDWPAVMEIYDKLLNLDESHRQENQEALFEASTHLDRPEKAIELAENLVEESPRDMELRLKLVKLYMAGNEFDKAHEQLQAAQSMDYYNAEVVEQLKELGQKRKKHRLTEIEEILRKEPDNSQAQMEAGDIYGSLGDTRKSLSCYQKAIHDPEMKNVAGVKLALAMIELRMFDLAEESIDEVDLRASDSEQETFLKDTCYKVAQAFQEEAFHDRALKIYKKIFRVDAAYKDVVDKIDQLS
ncbi:MAG: tetratricopeptide repeat protein [Candidatus Sumerlaeia bacterium]